MRTSGGGSGAPVRTLLLAAGWGTRLGAHAQGLPKALVPFGGRTALDVALDRVEALGSAGRVDVWTHEAHRPHFERWAAARPTRLSLRVLSNGTRHPEARLGAIGDLAAYLERVAPAEPLLLLAADNAHDLDLAPLAETAQREVCAVVHDVGSTRAVSRLASVRLDARGRILALREKDPAPRSHLAATALYGVPVRAFDEVPRYLRGGGSADSLGSLLEWWVPRRPVRGLLLPGRWIDVGHAEDLERARRWFGEPGSDPAHATTKARVRSISQ